MDKDAYGGAYICAELGGVAGYHFKMVWNQDDVRSCYSYIDSTSIYMSHTKY